MPDNITKPEKLLKILEGGGIIRIPEFSKIISKLGELIIKRDENLKEDINSVSQRVDNISQTLQQVSSEFRSVYPNINSIDKDVDQAFTEIQSLSSGISQTRSKVQGLKQDLEEYKSDQEIKEQLESVKDKVKSLEGNLMQLREQTIPMFDEGEVAITAINFLETFTGDDRLDASAIKNLEENIDVEELDLPERLKPGDLEIDASQVLGIEDLLPSHPPEYAGGSGSTFLHSMRDVIRKEVKDSYNGGVLKYNTNTGKWGTRGDINAGSNDIKSVNSLDFDILSKTNVPAHDEGTVFYSEEDKALSYYNDQPEITLNIGQESVTRVKNAEPTSINNGDAVYISGATGGNPDVNLAQADSINTSISSIGIVTQPTINSGAVGYITNFGIVRGLDTSSYTVGDELFISSTNAGSLTNTQPEYPNTAVRVGFVTRSHPSEGKIFIDVDRQQDIYQEGSVIFANTDGRASENNTEFYWDRNNNNLGIRTNTPNSTLDVNGSISVKTNTVSSSTYSTQENDHTLFVDTSSNEITVTISSSDVEEGRMIIVKDSAGNSSVNNITVETEGAEKIDGGEYVIINDNYNSVTLQSDGANWFIV